MNKLIKIQAVLLSAIIMLSSSVALQAFHTKNAKKAKRASSTRRLGKGWSNASRNRLRNALNRQEKAQQAVRRQESAMEATSLTFGTTKLLKNRKVPLDFVKTDPILGQELVELFPEGMLTPTSVLASIDSWQEPRLIVAPGLSNTYQVSPMLYRGAQPKEEGYQSLADMGIKAVVSLRTQEPNTQLLNKLGLISYHVPIITHRLNDQHVRAFLKILSEQEGPIYIHCQHGSDRTGTMIALYRILHDHWSRKQALAEMKSKEFGFHKEFYNLVEYIKNVKLENIMPAQKQKL